MSELDKKIQKSQPDLVQAVLEAQDKKNNDRIEALILNALKQLKMSRFKPDQATYLSLIYLARISPKLFSSSEYLKDLLKSHLRRDNAPANVKATIKNDFILPVLAANILLASSDTPDIRAIILKKIEQWLSSNQKITENVQHLLAILCVRCQGDPQTTKALIEIRHHWFQCLDTISVSGGSVASDLCISIRKLLRNETTCRSLLENLSFLIKHDKDITGLSQTVSSLILQRPITIDNMLRHPQLGKDLKSMFLHVYNNLFKQLKLETKKAEEIKSPIYFKLPSTSQTVVVEQNVIEAMLTLLAWVEFRPEDFERKDLGDLFGCWLIDITSKTDALLYNDVNLTTPFPLSTKLRHLLIQSDHDTLIDIGLHLATPSQLAELLQKFGTPKKTIAKILDQLNRLSLDELNRLDIKDMTYLNNMLDIYSELQITGVSQFKDKLEGDEAKPRGNEVLKKIKVEH